MDGEVLSVTMRPEDYYALRHELSDLREKVNKYRWHDLRKNPDDLPEEDINYKSMNYKYSVEVLVITSESKIPKVAYINLSTNNWYDKDEGVDVIKWKYIDMPEDEESSVSNEGEKDE